MDVVGWLKGFGLEQYAPAFLDNDIEADTLPQLTAEDLIALGVTSIGHRRKLLSAIDALRGEPTRALLQTLPAAAESASVRVERRQLTVMFIDLVGSTALSQRLDPEDMRDVIRSFQSAVSAEIVRYEGLVAKLMGDAVLAYFGWPRAHEDDAERAVRSALAAAAATAALAPPGGDALAARVGIATGLVVVGDLVGEGSAQEEAVVGDTPNLAARLQSVAEPGSVVIADGTHRLVAGLFEAMDLGHQNLKGFASGIRAWRIVGDAPSESRFEARHETATPLVGRVEELELLFQRWQRAGAGEGQVVLLSGEAGIGKSRLIAALNERISTGSHARLRYFGSPYHINSALYPIITQIGWAGFGRDDGPDLKLDKLEALRPRLPSGADVLPLLAALLSVDATSRYQPLKLTPSAQKSRTLAALTQLIEVQAAAQPLLVLVEDAHWLDPTTTEWLGTLSEQIRILPVLLVVTSRPEFQPHWSRLSQVTMLSLSRLGRDEGAAIMERVAGGRTLPDEVRSQILAKTEGIPLFVEELTKTVLDSGLLTRAGDRYELSGPLPPLAIPSTLQDSLTARLDRLASVKEVAQIGACIGRLFPYRLLASVAGIDAARLKDILDQLEESELVYRRGSAAEANYTFKHALIRDTAYQSLLKSRRQHIHASIASVLETQFPEVVEAEPETLANHFTLAGLGEQAVSYWLKAGQRALKRSANLEAAAHLGKGLELAGSLPESESRTRQELAMHMAVGLAMMAARGFSAPEVREAFSAARGLADTLGDKTLLFNAMRGESAYLTISGGLRDAEKFAGDCETLGLQLAEASGDSAFIVEAHHQFWGIKFYLGEYDESEFHANKALAVYDPDQHHHVVYTSAGHDPGVCCRTHSSWILCMRGHADRAVERMQGTMALAERIMHPISLAQAQIGFSFVHLLRREPDQARLWAQKAIELCTEFVMPLLRAQARCFLGSALAEEGELEEGIRLMRDGISGIANTGADMGMANYLCMLAQACGRRGDAEEAVAIIDRGLENLAKLDSTYQLPELLRTKGELLSQLDPHDEAIEDCFTKSLTVARSQGTKMSELRTALRLARRYGASGRKSDAHDLLAPIHASFSEAFGTHDFIEASTLLRGLSH